MKKICILLSLLMLLPAFTMSSCSESEVNTEDTTPQASIEPENSASAETEETAEKTVTDMVKEKYVGTDFDGYEYRVLAPANDEHAYSLVGTGINEVYAEEMNGELINDSIWQRNALTQDFLNITITPVWSDGDCDGIRSQLSTEVLAGTTTYDTVLNRMDFMGTTISLHSIPRMYGGITISSITSMFLTTACTSSPVTSTFSTTSQLRLSTSTSRSAPTTGWHSPTAM